MHDGSITFSTALDNAQLEKDLAGLTKKIEKQEQKIADLTIKRDKVKEKGLLDMKTLDAEKAKLQEIKDQLAEIRAVAKDKSYSTGTREEAKAQIPAVQEELREQQTRVNALQAEWNKTENAVDRYAAQLSDAEAAFERMKGEAGYLQEQINAADQARADALSSAEVADQRIVDLNRELLELKERQKELGQSGVGTGYQEYDNISAQIAEINNELKEYSKNLRAAGAEAGEAAKGVEKISMAAKQSDGYIGRFTDRIKKLASRVFVFTVITTALRSMRTWMGKVIKTNSEAQQSIARLKGALLTLAQPLVEVVVPAFITLVNVLSRVIAAIAQLVSVLFGKTLKQSSNSAKNLYKEANALGAVGSAADDAAGSLAGFDEINTINTESSGGGAGGAVAGDIAPDFSWMDGMDDMLERIKEIADLVGLIAAGLALWKISGMLPGVLGTIAQKLAGILLTVGGLLLLWHGLTDAWENGVDWLNLIEMVGGLAAAALGLYLLLGPIAAGIGLVVGGLALLVTGFHDAMENGWNLQNTLLTIAGILAAGLGIALITGSWIPLLIAGIASVLLALTVATGHGEELIAGVQMVLEGFVDFFTGIFTGDIERAIAGIGKIFDGLGIAVSAVIEGVKDAFFGFLDWLDEKTNGRFHGIIETAKGFVTEFFDNVKTTFLNWIDGAKAALTGLVEFISGVFTGDWEAAWEGVKDVFKGLWNSNIAIVNGAINLIIKGLNWLIAQINKVKFDAPDWVPVIGGKSVGFNIPSVSEVQIPRLAQGAVIPPNREFMTVLGDQTSGNNLEAPESLIRKIVREESGGGNTELLQAILEAIKAGHIIMVDRRVLGQTVTDEQKRMTRQSGRSVVLG